MSGRSGWNQRGRAGRCADVDRSGSARRGPHPSRLAKLIASLFLIVGTGVLSLAQASAAELVGPAPRVEAAAETAQCRAALHDHPPSEVSALRAESEAETDADPGAGEVPSVTPPVFGCAAPLPIQGQVPQVVVLTCRARSAASPVLARAPPRAHAR